MRDENLITWTLMITRYAQHGFLSDAIDLFCSLLVSEHTPNRFTLTSLLSATVEMGFFSLGKQLHSWVIRSGLASDVCEECTLVDMYAKCAADGSVENSRKVFNSMPLHNVMSWTTLISGYVQRRKEQEAKELFCNMLHGHVAPNCFNSPASSELVQIFLILASANNCMVRQLNWAFPQLIVRGILFAITDAHAKALDSEKSFNHDIENPVVGAGSFTYACLLSGVACLGTIGRGEKIHALIVKSGFETDLCINNALISMYSKCRIREAALQVFNDMGHRNVITWTSIISTLAKHGFAIKALELFYEMLEIGVKPNEVTYIAVLSACSHVGLIDEAWKHFNSMLYNYDISPRMEHYACMVDLLGRYGLLVEVIEFITSMPFDADALREPHDSATYILLSNLYASERRWGDVAAIRKCMKQKKMIKETGYSWIEIDNQIHKFHVGDTSHPHAKMIYDELDELALKIKNSGYIPNTDFLLHDVEDEQKDHYMFQHSEKIDVAFALIKFSPRTHHEEYRGDLSLKRFFEGERFLCLLAYHTLHIVVHVS
ncbi:hypothetical protein V8G54_000117 (mitochondrion) [Vigna mungo]|uniref:DYW domain-containing protein n=1 Tax=Vigna mungo TaxID=3915 RepID=A0AAQ3PHF3_VIGMU